MGKESLPYIPPNNQRSLRYVKLYALACLLTGSMFLWSRYGTHGDNAGFNSSTRSSFNSTWKDFEWSKVQPSKELKWTACYAEGRECARLEVPLDYHDHSAGNAAIALLRIPATTKGKDYKGPVLFNPGGPGGSGVSLVARMGSQFQAVLGDEYDIVGFDPRGIGHTTPVVDIFDIQLDRAAWGLRNIDSPFMNETSSALPRIIARSKLINELVSEKATVAAQHVNTAVVARDMLSITRAHGYEKLQYWGFSYGSVLGSTFASLYPDNVGRLVIDGVVDAHNYYQSAWDNNLERTDAGLDIVFQQCAEAGKSCAFHETTADAVKERYQRLVESIEKNPVPVHQNGIMSIVAKKHVRGGLLISLYQPYALMKMYFLALQALEQGDGQPLYQLTENFLLQPLHCDCNPLPADHTGGEESGAAVHCSDGPGVGDDPEELYSHFEKLAKMSYFGDIWSEIRMRCVGWKVKAKWQWRGPVTGNTSFPLLLVGNTEDPVTPHAKRMSKSFKDSVVLMQNSAGHCSLAATSFCTIRAIRDYFREGIMPAKGTLCEIEDHMFLDHKMNPAVTTNEEDGKVLEAWRSLKGRLPLNHLPHRF